MAKKILDTESKKLADSVHLSASQIEGYFDGQIGKETIYVGNGKGEVIGEVSIKTKLKKQENYHREYDEENFTHLVTDNGVTKDSFVCGKNYVAHKILFSEKQKVEIELLPTEKAIFGGDKFCVAAVLKNSKSGVGLSINTDGITTYKKDKIKIDGATKVEIFIKVTTGLNPINKQVEKDEQKLLESLRGQLYLMESELFDILKMKHLMDIDKLKIME